MAMANLVDYWLNYFNAKQSNWMTKVITPYPPTDGECNALNTVWRCESNSSLNGQNVDS